MKNKWLITENKQLINLSLFESFWIEEVPSNQWHVFGKDFQCTDWRMAEFDIQEDAKKYLCDLYEILIDEE